VLAIWALRHSEIRKSAVAVLRAALQPLLVRFYLAGALYITVVIALLQRLGLWNISLLKDSILWFCGSGGLAAALSIDRSNPTSFSKAIKHAVRFTVIFEVIVNSYTFSLPVELVLVPLVTLILCLQVVAERLPQFKGAKYDPVRRLLANITGLVGIGIIAHVIWSLFSNFGELAGVEKIKDFLLPMILAICFTPFVYAVRLYDTLEQAALGVRLQLGVDNALVRTARSRILRACGVNLWKANFFAKNSAGRFWDARDEEDVQQRIRDVNTAWKNSQRNSTQMQSLDGSAD